MSTSPDWTGARAPDLAAFEDMAHAERWLEEFGDAEED